jgi:N-acetylmuramoyl-L-alanine amidase
VRRWQRSPSHPLGLTANALLALFTLLTAGTRNYNGIDYLPLTGIVARLHGTCWQVPATESTPVRFIAIIPAESDSSSLEYTFIPDRSLVIHNQRKLRLPIPARVENNQLYLPAVVAAAIFPELDVPVLSTIETDKKGDTILVRFLLDPVQTKSSPLLYYPQKNSSLEYRLTLGCRIDSAFSTQLRLLSLTSPSIFNGIRLDSGSVGTNLLCTFRQPTAETVLLRPNGVELRIYPLPPRRVMRIMLDPGHGGNDPGAVGRRGTQEKDIVLDIARRIRDRLVKKGFEVFLTREGDEYVSLAERAEKAARSQAQIFISIHANSSENRAAHGLETYFLSEAKTDWERAVAARENEVFERELTHPFLQKDDPVSFILADLAQHEFLNESSQLALRIQQSGLELTNASDRGVRQANFYVLRNIFMPAVLVECGFLSNRQEEQYLRRPEHREKIARAIADGIAGFARDYETRLNGNQR